MPCRSTIARASSSASRSSLTKSSEGANGAAWSRIRGLIIMGGVEIKVPDGWEVTGNMLPIMGGADIRTKAAPSGRRLIVNGAVIMGGVEIKSVAQEAR